MELLGVFMVFQRILICDTVFLWYCSRCLMSFSGRRQAALPPVAVQSIPFQPALGDFFASGTSATLEATGRRDGRRSPPG